MDRETFIDEEDVEPFVFAQKDRLLFYTGNDMKNDTPLTSSLLKIFSMFEIHLSVGDVNFDEVSLKCIKCKRTTGLKIKPGFVEFYDKIMTPFMMNSMLHHVGMSWMTSSAVYQVAFYTAGVAP